MLTARSSTQRDVTFTACADIGSTPCDPAKVIIRAQVNFQQQVAGGRCDQDLRLVMERQSMNERATVSPPSPDSARERWIHAHRSVVCPRAQCHDLRRCRRRSDHCAECLQLHERPSRRFVRCRVDLVVPRPRRTIGRRHRPGDRVARLHPRRLHQPKRCGRQGLHDKRGGDGGCHGALQVDRPHLGDSEHQRRRLRPRHDNAHPHPASLHERCVRGAGRARSKHQFCHGVVPIRIVAPCAAAVLRRPPDVRLDGHWRERARERR